MEVHFTPELERKLHDLAAQRGQGTDELVRDLVAGAVDDDLKLKGLSPPTQRQISEVIAEIMADTPSEEIAKIPKDGASEHDHYIYGWPKRYK